MKTIYLELEMEVDIVKENDKPYVFEIVCSWRLQKWGQEVSWEISPMRPECHVDLLFWWLCLEKNVYLLWDLSSVVITDMTKKWYRL